MKYPSLIERLPLPKKLPQQYGFTLVELVLVIVLLAIVSAVALPRFFGRSAFDERVFFDDTLNAIRYSQKMAVATGCNVRFSVLLNGYTVLRENTNSCENKTTPPSFSDALAIRHPATGEMGYSGSHANITLTASQATTTFDALGRADADNTVSVGPRQISIIATTGFSYDSTP